MNLDLGTVLLQWATGGLLFFWWTARREVVGLGYGWLLRGVYATMALVAVLLEARSDHTGAGHVIALVGGAGLVLAALTAFGVSAIRRADDARGPILLDIVAPAFGLLAISGLAAVSGGAYWLAALRLLSGAVFLGAVTDAMLLGHWYLVQPGLSRAPLEELVTLCLWVWPIEVIALCLPPGMLGVLFGNVDDGYGGLLGWMWVVSALTTIVLVYVTKLALREQYYSAVMAATGLLYLAILTAFGTDVVARALLTP
ncbi:MAG: hypothetical protein ACXVKA_15755 [Acidimicrobiia bacterium]